MYKRQAHERAQEREAGEWLTRQIDKNYERQVKEWQKQSLQSMSDNELLAKLKEVRARRGVS